MQREREHMIRQVSLQVMFVWDCNGAADPQIGRQVAIDQAPDPDIVETALAHATSAWDSRTVADPWVERLAPQWPVRRQPAVDRNVLRLAVWELTTQPTPPRVVLDEAIELAKVFSTEESGRFVNGVLDAILRERNALIAP